MKYQFLGFTLDSKKQALFFQGKEIEITKTNYQVLLLFLQKQGEVITKEQIIDEVWNDKIVTQNSIDQAISKIRKTFAEHDDRTIIKTAYGKGFQWIPEVILVTSSEPEQKENRGLKWATILPVLALLTWFFFNQETSMAEQVPPQPVLWLQTDNNNQEQNWLDNSSQQLLQKLFKQSGNNRIIGIKDKPRHLDIDQFVANYQRINPELQVINSELLQLENGYFLSLSVEQAGQTVQQSFTSDDLTAVMIDGHQWLFENSKLNSKAERITQMLPADVHVLELYLRSLDAMDQGLLDQAQNYTQLVIEQSPEFVLGQLQLAEVQNAMGDTETSLETLELLKNNAAYPTIQIAAQSLYADILDTMGLHNESVSVYQSLLNQFPEENNGQLLPIKIGISYPLTALHRYDDALQLLDEVIVELQDEYDLDMLSKAWHRKGSVLLQVGRTEEAKQAADLAYQHYNNMSDLMSAAMTSSLLARIANHEAEYDQASDYLMRAIAIYREADYRLGVGAALNELAYVKMSNGQLSQAWEHMSEMRQIAIEIDYFAMLMAAQQFEIEIARKRKQWPQAEVALSEYLRLSSDNNFQRGLFKHQLLALDLALDQGQIEKAQPLIENIQTHINDSHEVRLQPRLNVQRARVLMHQNNSQQALDLLHQTKALALQTSDYETIHDINNKLLELHIEKQNYAHAQSIINAVDDLPKSPADYPFLLLKSKWLAATGQTQEALKAALKSQKNANEFWQSEDQQWLNTLYQGNP
ncbi:winged helix-turn-helix domain-containing protein [Marinicella sp. S1101]|uniref:winged helix-turn-helix domain-containing protein n=1 Tax=Marinicella marina TaxID=2996016 RepID=UPI002261015E|nr:winged helix-turn-helix domain-containing protein [Marinicella marina]MCX7553365.1 winged helix-turn-helix domain-containing protein [Marinicella marina]